ncbi:MAG: hypothetical protein J0H92_16505 [Sphingobacteriales bacterium]|jgi:hypothetical protein|nr:hypothetical protein [Sphingobacteriales bacterium]NCT73088.1 hypothetical protein [Chitinophagaceae bacterium]OJW37270.1 MAG: hypothetical protein BGO54_11700 [Sphingobacteriales bacterium 46-32]
MIKNLLVAGFLILAFNASAQSVFGYWYGFANVKSNNAANNYLVEMILQPEKNHVKGVLNYYFKNTFRSLQVKGNYDANTRQLSLYDIPVTYHASVTNMEIDCIMNLQASLRVARAGSNLVGRFVSLPDYKYTCVDINFNLTLDKDSKQDSVLKAIREYKETYQVWQPSIADTQTAVTVIQRKVVNYVVENQFKERETVLAQEIEVNSDSLQVDFYDNGEVDGDSISVFFNNQLLAFSQKLSTRSIHFNLVLDSARAYNELTMFADNLGSIPPNTALMIVTDGNKQYQIRLSSNLQKNASVRIRRKKN